MDPPSQVLGSAVRFTGYSPDAFTDHHLGRLREVFDILDQRGCLVMLSSPNVALNLNLFDGYDIREVTVARSVKKDGRRRGRRVELVVRNFA
jgi:DNA adenine methylase